MSWFSRLFSSSAAEPIEAVGNVFDKLFTSDEERAQADQVMEKIRQHPSLVQAEINKVSASHRSRFVAGARPFLLWVCGLGFLTSFVISPFMQWFGFPPVETPDDIMMELTIAILGLATLRTYEKIKNKTK